MPTATFQKPDQVRAAALKAAVEGWTPSPVAPAWGDADVRRVLEGLESKYGYATPQSISRFAQLVNAYRSKREEALRLADADPIRHAYVPDQWRTACEVMKEFDVLLLLGGVRAMKSNFAAWNCMSHMIEMESEPVNPFTTDVYLSFQANRKISVDQQQTLVKNWLPIEKRKVKTDKVDTRFEVGRGFANDGLFYFESGRPWRFATYEMDVASFQGISVHRLWFDELFDRKWLDKLYARIRTVKGRVIITVAPLMGMNPLVSALTSDLDIIETKPCEFFPDEGLFPGCRHGEVPFIARSNAASEFQAAVMWFHTNLNPFEDWPDYRVKYRGRTQSAILKELYGVVTDLAGPVFDGLNESAHLVDDEDIPADATSILVADGAPARRWAMLIGCIDLLGDVYIFDEFPRKNVGWWVIPDETTRGKPKPEGIQGPGQFPGQPLDVYRLAMMNLEGARLNDDGQWDLTDFHPARHNIMDPRFAAIQRSEAELYITYRDYLAQRHTDSKGLEYPPRHFVPAPDDRVNNRVQLIQDYLTYDHSMPIGPNNRPKLRIHRRCQNLWRCLQYYHNKSDKEPAKDFIDCLGYMLVSIKSGIRHNHNRFDHYSRGIAGAKR